MMYRVYIDKVSGTAKTHREDCRYWLNRSPGTGPANIWLAEAFVSLDDAKAAGDVIAVYGTHPALCCVGRPGSHRP